MILTDLLIAYSINLLKSTSLKGIFLNQQLSQVTDQFTPEIIGILWISNDELGLNLKGFEEFNYLFDGLLSLYLYGEESKNTKKSDTNIFFTKNFNHHLFLIHLKIGQNISESIQTQLALIEKRENKNRKTILIFNQTDSKLQSTLEKSYPSLVFRNLEF